MGKGSAGKGSARRPLLESREVFESNWDKVFGSKPPTCGRCLVDEAAGKDWSSVTRWTASPTEVDVQNEPFNPVFKITQKMLVDPPTVTRAEEEQRLSRDLRQSLWDNDRSRGPDLVEHSTVPGVPQKEIDTGKFEEWYKMARDKALAENPPSKEKDDE